MDQSFTRRRNMLGLALTAGILASCVGSSPLPTTSGIPSTAVEPTPTATTAASPTTGALCDVSQLSGKITMWTGAAGSRIANISVSNSGAQCRLSEQLKPQLLDGHGNVLVDGTVVGAAATIGASATLTSLVSVSNYCGPTPAPPVTIGLVLTGRTRLTLTPPNANDISVPPCNGPGAPGHMEMHPWS